MNLYFATTAMGLMRESALTRAKVKKILVSFAYKESLSVALKLLEKSYPNSKLIIDSGAFTAWSKGEEIDLEAYGEFCLKAIEKVKGRAGKVFITNLDVIPGEMGKNPTKNEINKSAERGLKNLERMEQMGLNPIHIFHQFEDFEWLEILSKKQKYIGISPSNACSVQERLEWLKHVFFYLKDDLIRTHGFGVTGKDLMQNFPWYSVDSSSWFYSDVYGRPHFTAKKNNYKNWFNSKVKAQRGYILEREIKELLRLEKINTELWKLRGVDWEKRDEEEEFLL